MASQSPPCREKDEEDGPVVGDDPVPCSSGLQISWSTTPQDDQAQTGPDTTALKEVEAQHVTQTKTFVSDEEKSNIQHITQLRPEVSSQQQREALPELSNPAATDQGNILKTSNTVNLFNCDRVTIDMGSKTESQAADDPNDSTDSIVDPYNDQIKIKQMDHKPPVLYRKETSLPKGGPLNLILVGKTGNGKSATGNTIFCRVQLFNSSPSTKPETKECQMEHGIVGGREIYLVDTPGNMDPKKPKQCLHDIGSAIFLRPDGYDAIILILKHGSRITPEEQKAIEQLQILFGKDIFRKHAVIVFTNGDNYDEDMPFEDFVRKDADGFLERLLVECKHRFLLFDNKITRKHCDIESERKSSDQVIKLTNIIDQLVQENNGEKYIDKFFKEAKDIQQIIEEYGSDLRIQLEKEKDELEKQLKEEKEEKRRHKAEEEENRRYQLQLQQNLQVERLSKKLLKIIDQEKQNCEDIWKSSLAGKEGKRQQQWAKEVESMHETRDLSKSLHDLKQEQELQLSNQLDEEIRTADTDIASIFTAQQMNDSLKFKEKIRKKIKEKENLHKVEWESKSSKTITSGQKMLKVLMRSVLSEMENNWSKELATKQEEQQKLLDCEVSQLKQEANQDLEQLCNEKLVLDDTWRDIMDALKEKLEFEWRYKVREKCKESISEWNDDVQQIRLAKEQECQNQIDLSWQTETDYLTQSLRQERSEMENVLLWNIRKDIRHDVSKIQETFQRKQEVKQIEEFMQKQFRQCHEDDDIWLQELSQMLKVRKQVENDEWNKAVTECNTRLKAFFKCDVFKHPVLLKTHDQREFRDKWKQTVSNTVEGHIRKYKQQLKSGLSILKANWDKIMKDDLKMHALKWKETLEQANKRYEDVVRSEIQKKLKKKIVEADDLMSEWAQYEERWYTKAEKFRYECELKWKDTPHKLSEHLNFSVQEENVFRIKQCLEEEMNGNTSEHEDQWLQKEEEIITEMRNHFLEALPRKFDEKELRSAQQFEQEVKEKNFGLEMKFEEVTREAKAHWRGMIDDEISRKMSVIRDIVEQQKRSNEQFWLNSAFQESSALISQWKSEMASKLKHKATVWCGFLITCRKEIEWQLRSEFGNLQMGLKREMGVYVEAEIAELKKSTANMMGKERTQLEKKWMPLNENVQKMIVEKNIERIISDFHVSLSETRKEISHCRNLQEQKWELALRAVRMNDQTKSLDEVCLDRFGRKFAEVNVCFPANASVQTDTGTTCPLHSLKVGDYILCSDEDGFAVFSPIYHFGHMEQDRMHVFIKLVTEKHILKVSPYHHIHVKDDINNKTTKAAINLKPGDNVLVVNKDNKLVPNRVLEISLTMGSGLYAPYTLSGTIIADGVLASCYTDRVKPSLAHCLLSPARFMYCIAPGAAAAIGEWRKKSKR